MDSLRRPARARTSRDVLGRTYHRGSDWPVSSPVSIFRPTKLTSLVYDSPHSGRYYPPTWRTLATREELRLGEDAFVADLLKTSVPFGAALLVDNYPRCYIDVNREMSDIDPELLSC